MAYGRTLVDAEKPKASARARPRQALRPAGVLAAIRNPKEDGVVPRRMPRLRGDRRSRKHAGLPILQCARSLGLSSVPAVVIDRKRAACCSGRGPDEAVLRAAGPGAAVESNFVGVVKWS